jgi:pimeloyl-ACP methyl ester carboxylesterase
MDFVYCHGLPGLPTELHALAPATHLRGARLLDRLGQQAATYADRVCKGFDDLDILEPIDVVGFSLGAMAAAHIAAYRPAKVRKLVLISPAAPLELGDFLPAMAGRPVFEAARRGALSLRLLSSAQSTMASLAPELMLKTMFASSNTVERALLSTPTFRALVIAALKQCLGAQQAAYRAELIAYAQPWAHVLDGATCETEIWQGDEDTWTPPAMARALTTRLPPHATLHNLHGLGHYTTLQAALARRSLALEPRVTPDAQSTIQDNG